MSTAFAEREQERRGLEDRVEIRTGGTHPADHVHDEVVEVMNDAGFDLADRTPRDHDRRTAFLRLRRHDGELFDARRRRRQRRGRHPRLGARRPRRSGPRPGARIRDEIERRVVALFDEFKYDRVSSTLITAIEQSVAVRILVPAVTKSATALPYVTKTGSAGTSDTDVTSRHWCLE